MTCAYSARFTVPSARTGARRSTHLKNAYVQLGWRNQYCGIFRYEADGVTYYFIDNEYYFARGQIYGEYDDAERFAYYSKAVLEVPARSGVEAGCDQLQRLADRTCAGLL